MTRPVIASLCVSGVEHLVAVHMSCPLVADKALIYAVLSLSCDINQHFIHSTPLTYAKTLKHCQDLLASLPAPHSDMTIRDWLIVVKAKCLAYKA